MRVVIGLSLVVLAIVIATVSPSRGDGESTELPEVTIGDPVDDIAEPIVGRAVMPTPGSEQPMRDPFTPYEVGGPAAEWHLDDLQPDEQAVALGEGAANPQAVQDAYAEAARSMAERARAESAARSLHLSHLDELGVVP